MSVGSDSPTGQPDVLLIHGLWMHGTIMQPLAGRLTRQLSCRTATYSYPSVTRSLTDNMARLARYIEDRYADPLDIVGHSLGGVLALRTLLQFPSLPVRQILCLGSPLTGSGAARALQRWPGGSTVLGRSLKDAVIDTPLTSWPGHPPAGMIAGGLGFGAGLVLNVLHGEHDGTVAVEETRLPGLTDHIVLPVSHTGMLLASSVADQAASFLRDGCFSR